MDKRTLRSRKGRPRNVRPYDRQNQSIFGKVCSTVKGLLNPSWLFNVSHWIRNSEEDQPGDSPVDIEETVREDNDVVSQSVSHGSKRLRLRFDDHVPSIQSSGTQTWPDHSSQNLYETIAHVQSPTTQSPLLENKETIAVLNGDDHSENSEGSASTSGCSSLVSSHKESNRLVESPFVNLLDLKNSRKRKLSSSKPGLHDLSSSRALWSSNFSPPKFQGRLPTISHTNQPSFNLSTFVGPSKLNNSVEKKVSSPFYEGRTTFGGASASRRMPPTVAPYQVDKTLRNQIRLREHNSKDSLEGMSSAAKRILLTLEKMSTPVADAKKIPNSGTSPMDLSLYLTPPKSRRNSQFTPSIASKGPPIANINTIAKLATLKNYGASRLRNTLLTPSSSDSKIEKNSDLQPKPFVFANPVEHELPNSNALLKKNISTSSPCDSEIEKKSDLQTKSFVFSNPIEHELPNNNISSKGHTSLPSTYDSKIEKNSDLQLKSFVFSSPIEHELPNNILPKENISLPVQSTETTDTLSQTWECSSCWVRNPSEKTTCIACETPRVSKESSSTLKFKSAEKVMSNPVVTTTASVSSTGFSFCNSTASAVFTFGTSKIDSQSATSPRTFSFNLGSPAFTWECPKCLVRNHNTDSKCKACAVPSLQKENQNVTKMSNIVSNIENFSTWECTSCWVRNPMKEKKCMACETLHPNADVASGLKFKAFEKPQTPSSVSLSTSQSANPGQNAGSTEPFRADGFGTSEAEAQNTTVMISGGSSSNTSAFQPTQTSENLVTVGTSSNFTFAKNEASNKISTSASENSVSLLGTTNTNFVFGSKNAASDKVSTVSQAPAFAFGSSSNFTSNDKNENAKTSPRNSTPTLVSSTASPVENISAQSSGGTDKSASEGFNFKVSTSGVSQLPVQSTAVSGISPLSTWECSSCWVRNPAEKISCVACETPRVQKEKSSNLKYQSAEETKSNPATCTAISITSTGFTFGNSVISPAAFTFGSRSLATSNSHAAVNEKIDEETKSKPIVTTAASISSTGFSFGNPPTSTVFTFGTSKEGSQTSSTSKPFSFALGCNTSTWECESCWVRNSETESKCKACEAARPQKGNLNSKKVNNSVSNTFLTWECTSCCVRNPMKEKKCMACETLHPNADVSSGFSFKDFEKPQTTISVSSSTSQSTTVGLNSGTSTTISSGGFVFGIPKTETQNTAPAPFTFGCGLEKPQTAITTSVSSSTSQPVTSAPVPSGGFVFGTIKTEAPNAAAAPFNFGSGCEKSHTTTSVASSTSHSTTTGLNVSTSASVSSGGFVFGAAKAGTQNTAAVPFAFGSAIEKSQSTPSVTSTSQSTTTRLNVGSSASIPSGGFVFGAPKAETQNPAAAPFAFGSGATSSNTSAFSAFQPTQSANPTFQFGNQPSGSAAPTVGTSSNFSFAKSEASNQIPSSVPQNSVSAFGPTTTNFVFGTKNSTCNQIPSTVSQANNAAFGSSTNFTFSGKNESTITTSQNSTPAFGSSTMPSVFGNTSVQAFGGADKPASGGFNFGVSTSGVFQFGATNNTEKKRTATASGFSFGTPTASEANNSFSTSFNMNTPPSFNFGAASTPAGPFQFAASTAAKPVPAQIAPRKYRKALRRVARKD